MARKRERKGYTDTQNTVAEWIKLGHTRMREDSILRNYAIHHEGKSSNGFNYERVKKLMNAGFDGPGDGEVTLQGSHKPGAPYVDARKRVWKGDVKDVIHISARGTPYELKIYTQGFGRSGIQRLKGIVIFYGG